MPAQTHKRSIEQVQKELDEHFAEVAEKGDPFALQVIKFNVHQRGSIALVKLPFRSDTPEFGVACRSVKNFADQYGVTCLFFDSRQQYESFDANDETALARFGLMRRPA